MVVTNCLDRMAFRRQKLCGIPRDCEKRLWIVGFVQISRSWKDFAVRNGKFVLTVNSIKTSRTRAKAWLILLGKQFRSVTQPHDERDTEFRRSADNLPS